MLKKLIFVLALLMVVPFTGYADGGGTLVEGVVWSSATSGTFPTSGTTLTMTGLSSPNTFPFNLSGSAFSAHPLSTSQDIIDLESGEDWTATFSQPVEDLHLYLVFWRGEFGGCSGTCTYTFDQAGSIDSGLGGAISFDGTNLILPDTGSHSGIIHFPGPLTSLSVSAAHSTGSDHAMTFGLRINAPPVTVDDAFNTPENTPISVFPPGVLLNDTDVDGDPLTAVLISPTSNGTLLLGPDGFTSYVPAFGFVGQDSFTYAANDGTVNGNTATVTIDVFVPNTPPVTVADAYNTPKNTPFTIFPPGVLINDTDADEDQLTAVLISSTSNGTLLLGPDGFTSYIPAFGFEGQDSFTYAANDGTVNGNTVTVTIDVVNTPPVTVDDAYNTAKNVALNVAAPGVLTNDSDPDFDPLTAVLISTTSNGALVLNADGSFGYTPNAGFSGQDSFTYAANDGTVNGNTATVTIDVINTPPVAVDDAYNTAKNVPLEVPAPGVLTNDSDADGDPLTSVLISTTSNGALVLNADGSFSYAPNAGFSGQDSFTYAANDGTVNGNTATVTIDVINTPPLAVDDFYDSIVNIDAVIVDYLDNDSDPDGDPISLQSVDAASANGGSIVEDDNGDLIYSPPLDFVGVDTFNYTITDGTDTDSAVISVDVKGADALIDDAFVLIGDFEDNGDMGIGNPGKNTSNANKLYNKLGKIADKLSSGDTVAACDQADSALGQTADMLSQGWITQATHDAIAAAFNDIKLSIPC